MNKSTTYDLILSALGAALITVGAFISLTVMAVPFTLQTLMIFSVLMAVGGKRGLISIICYILLGAVGLPVFSGFKGGFAVLMGPTGGFILGFIVMGIVYFLLADKAFDADSKTRGKRILFKVIACVISLVVLYAFGTVWFMTVYASQTGPVGVWAALTMCVIPFIIPDIIKLMAAVAVSEACRRVIKR